MYFQFWSELSFYFLVGCALHSTQLVVFTDVKSVFTGQLTSVVVLLIIDCMCLSSKDSFCALCPPDCLVSLWTPRRFCPTVETRDSPAFRNWWAVSKGWERDLEPGQVHTSLSSSSNLKGYLDIQTLWHFFKLLFPTTTREVALPARQLNGFRFTTCNEWVY